MRSGARLLAVVLMLVGTACSAPEPQATATRTPEPQAPEVIVLAFIGAVQDPARTLHAEWQGIATSLPSDADPETITLATTAAFDFNGPDYTGTIVTDFSFGATDTQSLARIDGVSFVQLVTELPWQRTFQDGDRSPEMDPLHGLTVADVTYDSPRTLDGREVHALRVLNPLAAFSGGYWLPMVNRAVETDPSEYLIYVDDNGTPVGAHVEFDLTRNKVVNGEISDEMESYHIQIDYTFSGWGDPITINPPPTRDPLWTPEP